MRRIYSEFRCHLLSGVSILWEDGKAVGDFLVDGVWATRCDIDTNPICLACGNDCVVAGDFVFAEGTRTTYTPSDVA